MQHTITLGIRVHSIGGVFYRVLIATGITSATVMVLRSAVCLRRSTDCAIRRVESVEKIEGIDFENLSVIGDGEGKELTEGSRLRWSVSHDRVARYRIAQQHRLQFHGNSRWRLVVVSGETGAPVGSAYARFVVFLLKSLAAESNRRSPGIAGIGIR